MKFLVSILALILVPASISANEELFVVDPESVLVRALGSIAQKYPDISTDDLSLEYGVSFVCWSSNPDERVSVSDEAFLPCIANINLTPGEVSVRSRYINRDGNCEIATDLAIFHANIYADGNTRAGRNIEGILDERDRQCPDGSRFPVAEARIMLPDPPFFIEPKKILEMAVAEVERTYPQVSADELFLNGAILLNCRATMTGPNIPGLHGAFQPCVANVALGISSTTSEQRYVTDSGKCMFEVNTKSISVLLGEDGRVGYCGTNGYFVSEEEVECSDEFYEAMERQKGKPLALHLPPAIASLKLSER